MNWAKEYADLYDRTEKEIATLRAERDAAREEVERLRGVEQAARAVAETAQEIEFPAPDGLGWVPWTVKDKHLEWLKSALARARSGEG